jgi:amino acid permease
VIVTIVVGVTSINKFDTLMSLCGSVVCTPLAMIIPPILHYKLLNKKQSKFRNILDILVCIAGTLIAVSVLTMTLINL